MQIYDGAFDFWDAVISRGEALFSFPSGGGRRFKDCNVRFNFSR